MKKGFRVLIAMSLVASLFVMGFAGNAAATTPSQKEGDNTFSTANSTRGLGVNQDQYVAQGNWNDQDDNTAVSASAAWNGGEAESGDAYAVQYSEQENNNAQAAWSNAENDNEQEQED